LRVSGNTKRARLYHLAPEVLDAVKILKPETIIRWHRAGFRPRTPDEIRQLIREMSVANPLWGAPRIHGELLKLGMDVGQTTVAKYMAKRRRPPSQGSGRTLSDLSVLSKEPNRRRCIGICCGRNKIQEPAGNVAPLPISLRPSSKISCRTVGHRPKSVMPAATQGGGVILAISHRLRSRHKMSR
jgi:hypothetical protein